MLGEGEFSVMVSSAGGDVAGGRAGEERVGAVATEVVVVGMSAGSWVRSAGTVDAVATEVVVVGASGVATCEVSGEMLGEGEFSVMVSSAGGDVGGGGAGEGSVGAVATEVVVVGASGVATCEVSGGSAVVLGV